MIICGCDLGGSCFNCTQPSTKLCEGQVKPPGYFEYDPVEKARIAEDKKAKQKRKEHERYLREREKRLERAKAYRERNRQNKRDGCSAVS